MGTVGYMSPEQASGQPVDFHSDQFTLGAILYEMATGKRAFQRKTGAETLDAIIREEPEPLSQLAPKAPAPVRWIVERCLAKDPGGALRLDQGPRAGPEERPRPPDRDLLLRRARSGRAGEAAPAPAGRSRRPLTLVAGLAAGFLLRGFTHAGSDARLQLQRLTCARGAIRTARFAPDGQTIVYGASWDGLPLEIFSTRADSSESRSLGLGRADVLSVSSSGELAISLDRHYMFGYETVGTLARVPLAGGAPREVLETVEDADWSPDGKSLAVARQAGNRSRLEYPIGTVIHEAAGWINNVRVSPDGRMVAFIEHPQRGDNNGNVKVVDTSGKVRLDGPPAFRGLAWSPRGDEVWSSGGNGIQATTARGKDPSPSGSPPEAVVQDIARDGRVLLVRELGPPRDRRFLGGRRGRAQPDLAQLVLPHRHQRRRQDRPVQRAEHPAQRHLPAQARRLDRRTPGRRDRRTASLRIGRWALSLREDNGRQFTLLPTGAGEPKELPESGISIQSAGWFPDGRRILISGTEPGHGSRLFVQELPDGKPRAITPEGVHFIFDAIAPDGKSAVATGPDRRVAIYPTEPGEPRPCARAGARRRPAPLDGRRELDLRLSSVLAASASRNRRCHDGTPHPLEGDPASGPVRRRPGRPDRHRAGRSLLRLLLPARARRAVSGDRNALSASSIRRTAATTTCGVETSVPATGSSE